MKAEKLTEEACLGDERQLEAVALIVLTSPTEGPSPILVIASRLPDNHSFELYQIRREVVVDEFLLSRSGSALGGDWP